MAGVRHGVRYVDAVAVVNMEWRPKRGVIQSTTFVVSSEQLNEIDHNVSEDDLAWLTKCYIG